MSRANNKRLCNQCGTQLTRAVTGVCWRCKPAPTVRREGDGIHVGGLGHMTTEALKLAHRIADEVTP